MTWQPRRTLYHAKRSPQLAKCDREMALCSCPSVGVHYGGGTSRGIGTGPIHCVRVRVVSSLYGSITGKVGVKSGNTLWSLRLIHPPKHVALV
jgi:hypothetical protein